MTFVSDQGVRTSRTLLEVFDSPREDRNESSSTYPIMGLFMCRARLREAEITAAAANGVCCAAVGTVLLSGLLLGPLVALLVLLVLFVIMAFLVNMRIGRRREQIDRDLPALLTSIASSVRAGVDPLTAVGGAGYYFSSGGIMTRELAKFKAALAAGTREEVAISGFCSEIKHPDLPLFRTCLILARRHGSSLADPLHRVTKIIRQRQSFRRKTCGALVMHRMSALGIALCAVFIGVIQGTMNLDGVKLAVSHPVGGKVLGGGSALIVAGIVWMLSLGSERRD